MTRAEKREANKAAHVNKGRGHNKGSGIPASGPGWGGPANGASASRIKPGDPDGITRLARDPAHMSAKDALAEEMTAIIVDVARDETVPPQTRVIAADKVLDRVQGKPIARTVTTTVDDISQLTDIELAAEAARLARELGLSAAGDGEAAAGKPPGAVPPVH